MSTNATDSPTLDLHNHSNFSDGQMPPEGVAQALAAKGLRGGLADHALVHGRLRSAADFALYYAAADRNVLLRGLEVDLGIPLTWPIRVLEEADYLIGSLHGLTIGGEYHSLINYFNHRLGYNPEYQPSPALADRPRVLDAALAAFRQGLDDWPINILGHCTLLPSLEDEVPVDWAEAVIRLAVERGVAIEISGLWRLPSEAFLERALELGATFSVGSDGHTKGTHGQVGYCLEMIQRLGIPSGRLFAPTPRRRTK
ncbi:MAG TPA: PHP domain-containing protein [Bacillota bacterium]